MASYGRKRLHLETRVRKEDASSRTQKEALPGGAFAKRAIQPKSIADFEAALTRAESGGADLVQVWTDFALWAKRLPGKEQLSILKRACRSLAAEKMHAQDIRQLRLWVMLADKEPRPGDIFKHLEARGIGTNHALLFEAWAHSLEARHDFEGAADAYRRGLTSSAQPQARLRARHADFEERMRQRSSRTPSRTEAAAFSTPPRDSRSWRLSHFRAIKTSLKKPSKFSLLRTRTPCKSHSHEEARHRPVDPQPFKESEPAKRPAMHSTRAQTRAEVDTRSRLTCRKQVAVERPARRPASPLLSKKCDHQPQTPIMPEQKVSGEKAGQQAAKEVLRASALAHPTAAKAETVKLRGTSTQASRSKALACPKAHSEPRRGLLGWLVPFGGFFRTDEDEDYLEDCEEESVMEDDETDELVSSPPEAKRRRLMAWLPW